jgi:hypothetical protein
MSNQIDGIVAIVCLVVTAAFRLRYVSVILGLGRRKILHPNVTQHRTTGWLSRQITGISVEHQHHAIRCETATRHMINAF